MDRVLMFVCLAALGCGGRELERSLTDAQRSTPAGDSSCYRTQSPTGCGPAIVCASTIDACAAAGCWIVGGGLYLYPDGSWRDPEPGRGVWSVVGGPPRTLLLDGTAAGVVAEDGAPFDFACDAGVP